MAELEDFNGEQPFSLEDLITQETFVAPVNSHSSNINLAAHTTMLSSDENLPDTYNSIVGKLEETPDDETSKVDYLLRLTKEKSYTKSRQALVDLLADPNYSDEDKSVAVNKVMDIKSEQYSMRNILSEEALIAPSHGESVEGEAARVSLADAISEINIYKDKQQKLLNMEVSKLNADTANVFGDLLEYALPFVAQKFTSDILDGVRNGEGWAFDEAFTLMGSTKNEIRTNLLKMPPESRYGMAEKIAEMVRVHGNITAINENDFAKLEMLRTFLEEGYYGDESAAIDNLVSVMDLVGLGAATKRSVSFASGLARDIDTVVSIAEDLQNARRMAIKGGAQPASVVSNLKDVNPSKARAAFEAMESDFSGLTSYALYGVTREEAIAGDLLPEITSVNGVVTNKVYAPDANILMKDERVNEVFQQARHDGGLYFFSKEKEELTARTVNDFESVVGLTPRKEMNTFEVKGTGTLVKAVYGPPQGGFSSPTHAIEMVKWALREYNIPEGAITLLRRDAETGQYVPSTLKEVEAMETIFESVKGKKSRRGLGKKQTKLVKVVSQKPDYLVQVEHFSPYSIGDVVKMAETDVKYNILDRIMGVFGLKGAGSLQRHVLDAHSMLHPKITIPSSVAVEKVAGLEKALLSLGDRFAVGFTKLPKDRQGIVDTMIKEANRLGQPISYNKMVADGLTPREIKVMKDWKKYWDTVYWLENADLAKTLRFQGYKEFVDGASDTLLFAKPVHTTKRNAVKSIYDYTTGNIRNVTPDEIKTLYDNGGTYAQLRQPIHVGDEVAEFIQVESNSSRAYLREINDTSQVLTYRPGYYSVHYKDPYFVIEKVTDSKGNHIYDKAVATAGSMKDAKLLSERYAAVNGKEYYHRADLKKEGVRGDEYWDLQMSQGRSAQRARGERLEAGTSGAIDPSQTNILNPVDSLVASVRSISQRTAMRPVLETLKKRALQQYSEFMPKNDFGSPVFTSNLEEIKYRGGRVEDRRKLADARTTVEYINSLENGYINHIDDFYKATLKSIANIAGEKEWLKLEKAAMWASDAKGPTGMAKNVAFNLYLALNPIRQFLVQSHQAIQLAANFNWMYKPTSPSQLATLVSLQFGVKPNELLLESAGMSLKEAEEMFTQYKRTGLSAGVDKQNLIRGALSDLADQTAKKDIKVFTVMRKLGFDPGENINRMAAWLAHRDKAIGEGKSMADEAVQDWVSGNASNYIYNMNIAGEMPYSQNLLNTIFHFFQVPHKAFTTMTTNRALTPKQKLRLLGFNAVMYTLPPAAMYNIFGDVLPENQEARDAVAQGLEGAVYNKLLSIASGEKTSIDWSGLSPVDTYGTYEFVHSLLTTDLGGLIANSPSGQLIAGNNPRITNFIKTAARYTNLVDDYETPTELSEVAKSFLSLSSGMSNAFKAKYIMEYGQKINTTGGVTDVNVSTMEGLAQIAGFGTMDEVKRYWLRQDMYDKSEEKKTDVKEWYSEYKKHLLKAGIQPNEASQVVKTFTEFFRVSGNDDYETREILSKLISKDAQGGDVGLHKYIIQNSGIYDSEGARSLILNTPDITEEEREKLLQVIEHINSYKETE